MRPIALSALIVTAHILFVFGAYGTGLFGLSRLLPHYAVLAIWLGGSSVLAAIGYFKFGAGAAGSNAWARSLFALVSVLVSLYIGVFFAFNTFGT